MAFRLNTANSIITNTRTTSSRPSSCLSLPQIVELTQTGEENGLNLSLDYASKSSEGSDGSPPTQSPPSTTSKRSSVSSRVSRTRQSVGQARVNLTSGGLGTIEEGEEMGTDGWGEEEEQKDEVVAEGVQTVDRNGKLTSISKKISPVHKDETETKEEEYSTRSQKLTPKPAMLFVRSEVGTSTPVSSRAPSTISSRKQSGCKSTTSDTSCSCKGMLLPSKVHATFKCISGVNSIPCSIYLCSLM